jgi:hypothetical protein
MDKLTLSRIRAFAGSARLESLAEKAAAGLKQSAGPRSS